MGDLVVEKEPGLDPVDANLGAEPDGRLCVVEQAHSTSSSTWVRRNFPGPQTAAPCCY